MQGYPWLVEPQGLMETDWEMSIYNSLMSHVKSKSRNHVKHLSWFPTKTQATIMHKLDGEKNYLWEPKMG